MSYLGLVPGVVVSALLRFQDGVVFRTNVSQSQRQFVGEHGAVILGVEVQVHQLEDEKEGEEKGEKERKKGEERGEGRDGGSGRKEKGREEEEYG